jgi:hypothetical protein
MRNNSGYIGSTFLLAILVSPAFHALAEIQCPAGTPTEAEFYQGALKFYRKTSVDVYKSSAATKPMQEEEAVHFMVNTEQNLVALPGAPKLEKLEAEGRRLVRRGCTDPLVLYFLGLALYRSNHAKEAEPFLCQAADSYASRLFSARPGGARLIEI